MEGPATSQTDQEESTDSDLAVDGETRHSESLWLPDDRVTDARPYLQVEDRPHCQTVSAAGVPRVPEAHQQYAVG